MLLGALSLAVACDNPLPPVRLPAGHSALFIGNSLTYENDLPRTLSELAASVGDTIATMMVASAGFSLEDHLADGRAAAAIARGGWEFVVLQQGPSSLAASRQNLVAMTRYIDLLVRRVGGRTALYMVWPSADDVGAFPAVAQSYREAAQAVAGVFMPAGLAWQAAWAVDSTLPLYGGDGFHPSPMGTYLVALVMYERITGKDARALPGVAVVDGQTLDVPEPTVRVLQGAAHRANSDFPLRALRE